MKALFEYNGFTKMEEVPLRYNQAPLDYDLIVYGTSPKVTDLQTISDIPVESWTFSLESVEFVDGEFIAFYKYKGKR